MSFVECRKENRILYVTLAREEKHNAFNAEMIAEITRAFQRPSSEADVSAVFLSAKGKSFCSGADLEYMRSMARYSEKENREDSQKLYEMFEAVRACPVPTLVRTHGHVMGGGLGLVAACDIAVADEGSQFCFSEVRIGLVPAVISSFVMEKTGAAWSQGWMLTGRRFDAAEALSAGLVQFRGDSAAVESRCSEILKLWQTSGPQALRQTKNLLLQIRGLPREKVSELTTSVIARQRVSAEGQEGLLAFLEKRTPSWSEST